MKQSSQYFVGIDLGTTNTVVAYAPLKEKDSPEKRKIFEIAQLVAPGEIAKRPILPSFRYHPLAGEIAEEDCTLPWPQTRVAGDCEALIVGEWARELGAKVVGRHIQSAKSWLSHNQVDRQADILPWGGADGVAKVSPVVASASYLLHIRQAWNFEHPDAPLENQKLVITVPASFDADARALTLAAASLAGLSNCTLLEEPQAVCYHWYASHQNKLQETIGDSRLLMVCDVGGGTTDLSLISIQPDAKGGVDLTRVAVGDHLMLGGDNIDLALAHMAERRLQLSKALSAAQLSQLIAQTRSAKERLLAKDAPGSATVTLLGGGSRLIGGAKRCEFTREEVKQLALEGFLPTVPLDCELQKRRSAVVEFGLPFVADPAISKHFAQFLKNHSATLGTATITKAQVPDCLLFNGGLFNSPLVTERMFQQFTQWNDQQPVKLLENGDPHLAVAFGAVSYLAMKAAGQKTIGGGSARAFYLLLETQQGEPAQAVCLLPKGAQAGDRQRLQGRNFLLRLNEPVRFSLTSSTANSLHTPGELIAADHQLVELPPLVTKINTSEIKSSQIQRDKSGAAFTSVELSACLTEVGSLALDCYADQSDSSWALEFEARGNEAASSYKRAQLPKNFDEACERIAEVFGKRKGVDKEKALKGLRKKLEKLLGPRDKWDACLLRALFDVLIEYKDKRRRSAEHERLWLNLTGFCMRPGWGDAADPWRIEKLWPLYEEFLSFEKDTQSWVELWTFWRRAAGGLNTQQQRHIFEGVAPYVDPQYLESRKVQAEAQKISYDDILRLLAALERVPINYKVQLVEHLLTRIKLNKSSPVAYWAIGRIATRSLLHAGVEGVIPAAQVNIWLHDLLHHEAFTDDWERKQIAFCVAMMASQSNDRDSDVGDEYRAQVVTRLQQVSAPEAWMSMVTSQVALDNLVVESIYGDALPAGLKLL